MNKFKSPVILVLGMQGMLGRTVYRFIQSVYPHTTYGTIRNTKSNDKYLFSFEANNPETLNSIIKKVGKVDYIINCIGVNRPFTNISELITINALFPHQLEKIAELNNSLLLHISSDAVFTQTSKTVFEDTLPGPADVYGASKYLGETSSQNALTLRTSIIGIDPTKHKGFLESINCSKEYNGFINQSWSGCTTLQFASFCKRIIDEKSFNIFRNVSPIFHFAPISDVTKYDIAKTYTNIAALDCTIKKAKGEKVTRLLASNYEVLLSLSAYKQDIKDALQELLEFETINTI
jgi:dTDP-4-dehydrorhamnose reductase